MPWAFRRVTKSSSLSHGSQCQRPILVLKQFVTTRPLQILNVLPRAGLRYIQKLCCVRIVFYPAKDQKRSVSVVEQQIIYISKFYNALYNDNFMLS